MDNAEECEHLAAIAKLKTNKRALLESAEMWRRLAERAEGGAGNHLAAIRAPANEHD